MTLLQPWSAAIAGAVGLGVLTLLYVLKLRRRVARVGSTMLWEQALAEVEVNTPWKRLRVDRLFLLQALAIACLAMAVGRPALGIGSARQRIVIVIDASASMGAVDPGASRTRLEEAKRLAIEMVENLRRARGLEGAMVSFAREARVVRGFSREAAGVLEAIEGVKQTDEPGEGGLRAALEAVASLTGGTGAAGSEEHERAETTAAFVFSDGGFRQAELLDRPAQAAVKLVRIGPETRTGNIGIVSITAQRDEADPATVRIVARLLSTFPTPRGVSLRVQLNGQPVASSTATVAALTDQAVVLPVSVRSGGVLSLRVMNDDALASDNTAQVVIDGARDAAVVVVAPGGPETVDPLVANFAQSVSPRSRIVDLATFRSMGSPDWSGVDLIVFDRVDPSGALPAVASVTLGAGLRSAGVTLNPATQATPPAERVLTWKRDHPLMRDAVLDGLVLDRPGTLTLPARGVALADGARGPLIGLVEGADGIGHVVSALSAEQGGWGSDLSFVVFMGNAMDYLTLRGRSRAGRQIGAGEAMSARVAPGVTAVTVSAPDGTQRQIDVPPPDPNNPPGERLIGLGRAERVGVYSVAGAVEGDDRIAVNVASAEESGLATADALPLRGGSVASGEDGRGLGSRPREVWDWFVLAALGVLAVEWLAYAARARR